MTEINHQDCRILVRALGSPEDQEARSLLFSILKIVEPLICREQLHVGSFEEFSPANRRLLGLNHGMGEKIQIRLRHPWKDCHSFFQLSDLVGTFVHELVHNRIRRHSTMFYNTMFEWCQYIENYWLKNSIEGIVSASSAIKFSQGKCRQQFSVSRTLGKGTKRPFDSDDSNRCMRSPDGARGCVLFDKGNSREMCKMATLRRLKY